MLLGKFIKSSLGSMLYMNLAGQFIKSSLGSML